MAALLALLVHRNDVPVLGNPAAARSGELSAHIQNVFSKSAPFDEGVGSQAVMRRAGFGEIAIPGQNDWRNAFGSQKGIGCFATTAELNSRAFRHADRPACPHRSLGPDGDKCAISPAPHTRCRSVEEHAGETPKLLQIVPARANVYRYRLVPPEADDLAKFLSGRARIPLWPFMEAFYGGSSLRRQSPVVSSVDLYEDLGITSATAAALFDDSLALPDNEEIARMTEPFLIASLRRHLFDRGFAIGLADLINFYLSLKPRAFVILSGISGTGKSQLPRHFAELLLPPGRPSLANFELVPVRPGWNDVADLMGYFNSIHGGFEPGPALAAFRKAVQGFDTHGDLAVILLLDELNLSRVEHYFADFLSVMESRRFTGESWVTDPLRLAGGRTGVLNFVGQTTHTQPYVDSIDAELQIPDNLFVIGTLNIDESTQGISNKVLDRANTIELEDVDFTPSEPAAPQGYINADLHLLGHYLADRPYRTISQARAAHSALVSEMTNRLTALNNVLSEWRLHFGMRTRDEVCIYMAYAQDFCTIATAANIDLEGFNRNAAFDRQVLQKVLPRISGTREELQFGPQGNLFDRLDALLSGWGAPLSSTKLGRMKNQELSNFWEA